MRVFLSYGRFDASVAEALAEDMRHLGHTVWYDHELTGGQVWWNTILHEIRDCELFAFVLTSQSLSSEACRAEYTYASQLGKRTLPILCDPGVKVNMLPPELSVIQFVDYRKTDKNAAFALVGALTGLPESVSLPEPLPAEPPVPLSYLGDLRLRIESDDAGNIKQQSALFFEIKQKLKDSESRDDALALLQLLRARRDLFASVADEIDSLLRQGVPKRARRAARRVSPEPERVPSAASGSMIDISADAERLDAVLEHVAASGESWVLRAGDVSIGIVSEKDELVLATMGASASNLQPFGWQLGKESLSRGLAFIAASYLTGGLGLGLLASKKFRHYVFARAATRRFSQAQRPDAARAIVEAFRVLNGDVVHVVAARAEAPPHADTAQLAEANDLQGGDDAVVAVQVTSPQPKQKVLTFRLQEPHRISLDCSGFFNTLEVDGQTVAKKVIGLAGVHQFKIRDAGEQIPASLSLDFTLMGSVKMLILTIDGSIVCQL